MSTIIVAPTAKEHIDEIHAIETESFVDPWSKSALQFELDYKYSICLTAFDNKTVAGHVTMRHVINEGHINNIAVKKAYRRQGIGSLLMDALVKEAMKREMIGLTLEVRRSNEAALALYNKYGFVIEGYRKNYYSQPSEDAAVMWMNLNKG